MTYAAEAGVEGAGVLGVDAAEGAGEGVALVGDGDQVDVIGHKAEGLDSHAVVAGVVLEEIEVELVVVDAEVRFLPIVTALRNMVREAGDDQPWWTRHAN